MTTIEVKNKLSEIGIHLKAIMKSDGAPYNSALYGCVYMAELAVYNAVNHIDEWEEERAGDITINVIKQEQEGDHE